MTVTYGFGPGNTVTWTPSAGGVGGTTTLNPGGALIVTYASGTTAIGGFKTGPVTIQYLQAGWTAAFTLLANAVPGMAVMGGVTGAGAGVHAGATAIPAGLINGTNPPIPLTGVGGISIAPLGAATVFVNGSGTQVFIGPTFVANWTIGAGTPVATGIAPTGWIGQEISRVAVPEPSTALLLVGALGGLGLVGAGARKMRR